VKKDVLEKDVEKGVGEEKEKDYNDDEEARIITKEKKKKTKN